MRLPLINGPLGGSTAVTQILETIDVAYQNVQGASITLGYPVALTTTAASVDGKQAVLPAASNTLTFYGIALRTTPNNQMGIARAYGFMASVAIFATGTSGTIGAGVAMGPGAGSLGVNSTGSVFTVGPVISMESIGAAVNSPGGYARGFVRAM